MSINVKVTALLLLLVSLTGCKSTQEADPAYSLAQGCFAIQPYGSDKYFVAQQNTYVLQESSIEDAEKFFLKPSALGRFLIYDREGHYLSADGRKVTRNETASELSDWSINNLNIQIGSKTIDEAYTIIPTTGLDFRLAIKLDAPALIPTLEKLPTWFAFNLVPQPASYCTAHPEASLDAVISAAATSDADSGTTQAEEPGDPSKPVVGFADLHAHIGFPKSMGSVSMSGGVFHPYGIEHALADCDRLHGKDGGLDFLESVTEGGDHKTDGYPSFSYWPHRSSKTHIQAYYRWLHRAHLSGLKLIVTHVTGNPTFCDLLKIMHAGKSSDKCTGRDAVAQQTQYIYDLQDYIDAQEGGPGKGWLRVVTSPADARIAIADNQLAVVLGTEHGTLFDCREGVDYCTEEFVDQELQNIYDMGIRSVFPIHRFDNAFGGTRTADGSAGGWMHLTSMLSTSKINTLLDLVNPFKLLFEPIGGHFWEFDECPEGVQAAGNILSMKTFVEKDLTVLTDAANDIPTFGPLLSQGLDLIFIDKLGDLPEYKEFDGEKRMCNIRGLQDIGAHLINGIIDRGMIIEIDHMSYYTQTAVMDIIEERQYSGVISGHTWMESNPETRGQIFKLGGLVMPFNNKPTSVANSMKKLKTEMEAYPFSIGIAMSTDIQGVTSQAKADEDFSPQYPFTSIDGKTTFYQPKTGDREFDFGKEGMAHYGLYPEWVENFRQVDESDPEDLMAILMNSAETYLQMWERAYNAN